MGFLGWGDSKRDQPPVVAAPAPIDPQAELDKLIVQITDKVPALILARVQQIAKTIGETLPRLANLGAGSQQAYTVVATATSYLPEAVGAYLRLPREYADKREVSGHKTSLMVLCDQLDLLAFKMNEVFLAVCRSDSDALIAHGRFLAEKFGAGSTLTAPTLQPPSMS